MHPGTKPQTDSPEPRSTWERLAVGTEWTTGAFTFDADLRRRTVDDYGYVHGLFGASDWLPGEAVLLAMGGLLEGGDALDDSVVALVGLEAVRFRRPVRAGDSVRVHVRVDAREERSGGRGLIVMRWRAANQDGEDVCEATAQLLVRR